MTSTTRHTGDGPEVLAPAPTAGLAADPPATSLQATDPRPTDQASTGELLTRLSTQLSELVRGELELARTELAAKGKRAGVGAGLAGAGGVVALFGVGALVAAAIAGLAVALPVWLSALIVAAVLLIVAGVLAVLGRRSLGAAVPPVPEAAVENVQDDVAAIRQAVRR